MLEENPIYFRNAHEALLCKIRSSILKILGLKLNRPDSHGPFNENFKLNYNNIHRSKDIILNKIREIFSQSEFNKMSTWFQKNANSIIDHRGDICSVVTVKKKKNNKTIIQNVACITFLKSKLFSVCQDMEKVNLIINFVKGMSSTNDNIGLRLFDQDESYSVDRGTAYNMFVEVLMCLQYNYNYYYKNNSELYINHHSFTNITDILLREF